MFSSFAGALSSPVPSFELFARLICRCAKQIGDAQVLRKFHECTVHTPEVPACEAVERLNAQLRTERCLVLHHERPGDIVGAVVAVG